MSHHSTCRAEQQTQLCALRQAVAPLLARNAGHWTAFSDPDARACPERTERSTLEACSDEPPALASPRPSSAPRGSLPAYERLHRVAHRSLPRDVLVEWAGTA